MKSMIFTLLFLSLCFPAEAKKTRKPSNKFPRKAITFACREEASEVDTLIGVLNMTVDLRDPSVGMANTIIYVKKNKDFESVTYAAKYFSVPGGFVLVGKAANYGEIKLNVHPNEQTNILNMNLNCNITGKMESL